MKLGKDVFLALASIVWADGKVTPSEATALLDAARASGLRDAELAAVEAATTQRPELPPEGALKLAPEERLFVYGIAVWLAGVDGVVTASETDAIARLGDRLGLGADERSLAMAAAIVSTGDATASRDVTTLAKEIERVASET